MKTEEREAEFDLSETCDLGSVLELHCDEQAVVARISLGIGDIRTILRHLKRAAPKKLKTQKFLRAIEDLDGCLAGARVYIVGDSVLTLSEGVVLQRIRPGVNTLAKKRS